jgi:hypothetical protein
MLLDDNAGGNSSILQAIELTQSWVRPEHAFYRQRRNGCKRIVLSSPVRADRATRVRNPTHRNDCVAGFRKQRWYFGSNGAGLVRTGVSPAVAAVS